MLRRALVVVVGDIESRSHHHLSYTASVRRRHAIRATRRAHVTTGRDRQLPSQGCRPEFVAAHLPSGDGRCGGRADTKTGRDLDAHSSPVRWRTNHFRGPIGRKSQCHSRSGHRSARTSVELVTIVVPDRGRKKRWSDAGLRGLPHRPALRPGRDRERLSMQTMRYHGIVGPSVNVRDLEPGDYVVLNWRAVCGTCRACKRAAWYCFATFNATAKQPSRTGRRCRLRWASAFAELTWWRPGSAKVDQQRRGVATCSAAGDGGRCRPQHRQCRTRRLGGGDRLRRRGGGRGGRCPAGWGGPHHRRRRRRPQARNRARAGRDPHAELHDDRRRGGHPGPHRRVRCGRGHRRGRASRDLPAGLLRP